MDATGNFETFEYELGYAWLDILGFGGTFLFNYSYEKKNPYLDSPRNSATFEYKVDLLLNRPSEPPLNTNPNVASYQICTVCIVSNYVPKKSDSTKFSNS
jgi:hypothetical protein